MGCVAGPGAGAWDTAEVVRQYEAMQLVHLPAQHAPSPSVVRALLASLRKLTAAEREAGGGSIHKTWNVESDGDTADARTLLRDPSSMLQALAEAQDGVLGGGRWYVSTVVQDTGSTLAEVLRCVPHMNEDTGVPGFLQAVCLPFVPNPGYSCQLCATCA
jgi:hypothetical protein